MNWFKEIPFAITLCDKNGKIVELNDKAAKTWEGKGGYSLIGKNLFDCHNEEAKKKIKGMLIDHKVNAYTIEKNGIKKLIYQAPWFENNNFMGLIELSLEIPKEMPHFVRQ